MKLWLGLVAALACLVVGLGVGIAIGHATGHDDHGRFERFPGRGFGPGDGHRFRHRQFPNGLPGNGLPTPQPQPQAPSPSATP